MAGPGYLLNIHRRVQQSTLHVQAGAGTRTTTESRVSNFISIKGPLVLTPSVETIYACLPLGASLPGARFQDFVSSGFSCLMLQGFLLFLYLTWPLGLGSTLFYFRDALSVFTNVFYFMDALFVFTIIFCDRGDFWLRSRRTCFGALAGARSGSSLCVPTSMPSGSSSSSLSLSSVMLRTRSLACLRRLGSR